MLQYVIRPGLKLILNAKSIAEKVSAVKTSIFMESTPETKVVEAPTAVTNSCVNFIKIYFDFAYYCGCSPFHFRKASKGKPGFVMQTWLPQQIICALLHVICMLITEVRRTIPSIFSPSPEQYFAVIGSGFGISLKALTIKAFWFNKYKFLDIVNYQIFSKSLPHHYTKHQSKYLISFYCLTCCIVPLVIGFKNYLISPSSLTWWNRTIFTKENYRLSGETLSTGDYVLAALMGIGLLERLVVGFFFDGSLLVGVLTLWCSAHAFAKIISNDKEQGLLWTNLGSNFPNSPLKWLDLYSSYTGIRTLSFLINNAFGGMITFYLADSIMYHSMNLDAIVLTKDVFYQIHLLFFIVTSVMVLLFAEDICNQMDTLKIWLCKDEHRKMVPLDELNVVLHELNTRVVGIRGSDIFTITYSLVWNMLTTVVTYFIICVQARGAHTVINSGRIM